MRAGDLMPTLRRFLEIDGIAIDLTDATEVRFKVQGATGLVMNDTCVVIDAPQGEVTYEWRAADALVPAGMYQAWFEVTFTGATLTVPNGSYLVLHLTSVGTGEWTYSGNPGSSTRDAVRFYLQDTVPSDPQISDYELDFIIDEWLDVTGSTILVAATAAEVLAARYAREVSVSADAVAVALEQLMDRYNSLAGRLRSMAASKDVAGPDVGGVDLYEPWDPSVKPLTFAKGMHDNPWAGQQDYGGVSPLERPDGTYW